jgi:alanine racemase
VRLAPGVEPMMSAGQLPLRCWAEIDLAALERNVRRIRASLPTHVRYVAVVKADAYGHGLPQVAARLMHAGADLLAVANVAEASALRELSPDFPILVLGATLPGEERALAELDLAATVSSFEEVDRFSATARAAGKSLAVHLKIDTGMGRLGVWHEEAARLHDAIRRASGLRLGGVFTHLASADEDPEFTVEQRRLFIRSVLGLGDLDRERALIHADNSAGLITATEDFEVINAVRIGLLQFGVAPAKLAPLTRVQPEAVFSFHARVGLVKEVPAGTGISYGRTFHTARRTRLAILTAGYGDGLPRAASNRGAVLIAGRRCPILGRVCMDQTIVDATDLPTAPHPGDPVVLVGRQGEAEITLAEFSAWSDTIPWETLTSVTKRVPRRYRTPLGL